MSLLARTIRFGAIAVIWTIAMLTTSLRSAYCFPWSIDMFRGPEIQPYAQAPRVTPADTLPVHGEPPMSLEQATVKMHNPLQSTQRNLFKGKNQFNTYCAPCHGESGTGNGLVGKILNRPPKNLVAGDSKYLPDGYIYGVIRDGVLSMPSYAEEMAIEQRWQTVLYVRSLQQPAASKSNVAGK